MGSGVGTPPISAELKGKASSACLANQPEKGDVITPLVKAGNMAFLIEILLPVPDGDAGGRFDAVRSELAEKFGGVTLYANAPAEGIWTDGGSVEQDRIIVVEVMAGDLDRQWWASYRKALEIRFKQNEIVIRSTAINRL